MVSGERYVPVEPIDVVRRPEVQAELAKFDVKALCAAEQRIGELERALWYIHAVQDSPIAVLRQTIDAEYHKLFPKEKDVKPG